MHDNSKDKSDGIIHQKRSGKSPRVFRARIELRVGSAFIRVPKKNSSVRLGTEVPRATEASLVPGFLVSAVSRSFQARQ